MKKQFTISLIVIFALVLFPVNFSSAADLTTKLKGKILLQVENHGEAWYVEPKTGERYYMANGDEAYNIMRNLGVGITNKDLEKIKTDKNFAKKHSGKIFLQVESKGEAYYVDFSGNLHYLKNGSEAYSAMRNLGLGITNKDLEKIKTNFDIDDLQSSNENIVALSNVEIIKKVKLGVVYIETTNKAGSGMVVDASGYVLTNAHVVVGSDSATVTLYDGKTKSALVVGRDENLDIALLKMDSGVYSKVELSNSDLVQQGDEVFTLGFPFGIKGDVSFKEGTISRKLINSEQEYFEISAEIHPGNSGGPLVNRYGQVVGINTAVLSQNIQGVSIGETIKLAIPINFAKKILSDLKNGRNIIVEHKQPESNIPPVANTVDSNTVFKIKAQCQALGQQKEKSDNQLYLIQPTTMPIGAKYGYSPSLNTCIYGILYYFYDGGGHSLSNRLWTEVAIFDLMTNNKIWKKFVTASNDPTTLDTVQLSIDLDAKFESLTQ